MLGHGDAEFGGLLAQDLQDHQILGQSLLEALVLVRLLVFVGSAPGGLVRGLELVELLLRDEAVPHLGDRALGKVSLAAHDDEKRQKEQADGEPSDHA